MAKVYLSPSTQFDNIYSGVDTNEGDICEKIGLAAEKALKRCGFTVKRGTRNSDMSQRVDESNKWGADVHIPIHTNAGGGEGTEVFVYPGFADNKYAKGIYTSVAAVSIGKDRGIKENSGMYELSATTAMAVYVECEFHDTNGAWIVNNIDRIGEAIAKGCCKAEGRTYVPENVPENVPSSEIKYIVQAGAFAKKANAERLVNDLHKAGFDAFITTK